MNDSRFLEDYVRPTYTMLAKTNPDHIWIDDDIRCGHLPIGFGCFCDACIEKFNKKQVRVECVDDISFRQAFAIGIFQMLAIIPGTSRSGSTILGSMLIGLSRTAAAEFSFFMAIPAMAGASAIKALGFVSYVTEHNTDVPAIAWIILAVGCAVAFGVSMVSIKFLTDFVKKHSFIPFGVYRIVLGVALIVWFLVK
jgi:undecaprenyl-diphosphatase